MSDESWVEKIKNNYQGEFAKKQKEELQAFVKDEITDFMSESIKKLTSSLGHIKKFNKMKSQIAKKHVNFPLDIMKKKLTSSLEPIKKLNKIKSQFVKEYVDSPLDNIGKKVKKKGNLYNTNHEFTEHMKNIATHDDTKGKINEVGKKTFFKITSKYKNQLGDMSYNLVKKIGEFSGKDLNTQAKTIAKITKQVASENYSSLKRIIGKKSGGAIEKSIKYIGNLRNKDYSSAAKTLGKITKEMVKGKYNTLTYKMATKFPQVVSIGKAFKKSFFPMVGYAENAKTILKGDSKFLTALAITDTALDATQVIPGVGTALSTVGSIANFAGTVFYEAAPKHIQKKLDNGAGKIIDPVKNFFVPKRSLSTIQKSGRNGGKMRELPNRGRTKNKIQQKNHIKSSTKVSENNVYKLYKNNKITPKANKVAKAGTKIMGTRVDNSIKNQNKYTINISGTNKSTTEILNELVPRLKQSMSNNYRYA
ncbi:hypothetical protein [Anaerophilus nitritogenes]|uniref:hypothetical protein n=1 Tax=Anaerophilus nitritogenes TaxID=2498136 RepID=UPI00101C67E1|nr:hypothetical protein [Anaerophilus nitritogenes]